MPEISVSLSELFGIPQMGKKKQKLVLPPELPPDVPEEDIEVSDEDLHFINENVEYASLVSNLDTHAITKYVVSSNLSSLI